MVPLVASFCCESEWGKNCARLAAAASCRNSTNVKLAEIMENPVTFDEYFHSSCNIDCTAKAPAFCWIFFIPKDVKLGKVIVSSCSHSGDYFAKT